ncbi:MAG TPA: carboxypeptidase regulatory-like domain-containing protein [Gemmatimonadaceae bacterium]|nr:carboxypeptidase regulatory-like domain-containing protein [Gemmatimonadaceae bacterium]
MFGFIAMVALVAPRSQAQAPSAGTVTVHGIAFDSLRHTPLAHAFVALIGTPRNAMTDARGRFTFDSVAPGTYRIALQDAHLDSIGLSGTSVAARVSDGRDTVRISIPSFARLWRVACGTDAPKADTGFVYGTVREAVTQRPLRDAVVTANWVAIGVDRARLGARAWHLEARTDSLGGYALCGVPPLDGVTLSAAVDSIAPIAVDMPSMELRLQRVDLLVRGGSVAGPLLPHGAIAGRVTSGDDQPLSGARLAVAGLPEVRTGDDGRFILSGVPVGTHQVDVLAIGRSPTSRVVNVGANDTTTVELDLRSVTVLDSVRVTAHSVRSQRVADFEERRVLGFGHFVDSTELAKHATLSSVLAAMPSVRVLPGSNSLRVRLPSVKGGLCDAALWVDGQKVDAEAAGVLHPDDLAAIEVYPRVMTTPARFIVRTKGAFCGSVVVWTKRAFP